MPDGFDATFARVKELVADVLANEKFHLPLTSKSKSTKGQALPGKNVTILGLTLLKHFHNKLLRA
jgi:hypothetical protein